MAFEKGHKINNGRKRGGKTPSQKVEAAIKKVLANADNTEGEKSAGLFKLFNALYKSACEGDVVAHREFMDRYAGKVTQKVEAEFTQYLVQIGSEELQIKEVEEPLVIENDVH